MELELFDDVNKHLFFEDHKRGGLSVICHRLGESNAPEDVTNFRPNEPIRRLFYTDCTNLYGR